MNPVENYCGYAIKWTGWKGRYGQLTAHRISPLGKLGDHLELNVVGGADFKGRLPQMRELIDKWVKK